MPRVFISHSSHDHDAIERDIIAPLRAAEVDTWFSGDDIRTASHFQTTIKTALEACDWFLVVMTPDSVASRWVQAEVDWAMEHRPDRVIPVLLRDCDRQGLHFQLRLIQYVDFRDEPAPGQRRLLNLLLPDRHPAPTPAAPTPATPTASRLDPGFIARLAGRRKFVALGCGPLTIVAMAGVVLLATRPKSEDSPPRQTTSNALVLDTLHPGASPIVGRDTVIVLPDSTLKTAVVHLRHRRATELEPLVRVALSDRGRVAADATTNSLVITERASLLDDRLRLVRQLDNTAADSARGASSARGTESTQPAPAQPPGSAYRVAFRTFVNASVGRQAADLAPLRAAITDMFASELAAMPGLSLSEITADASATDAADLSSALPAARRAGARALILGSYVGDASGRLRISARLVTVANGQLSRVEIAEGRQDSAMAPIISVARRMRCSVDTIELGHRGCGDTQSLRATKLDVATMKKYSSALDAMDQHRDAEAAQLLREILAKFPDFAPAQKYLDRLSGRATP